VHDSEETRQGSAEIAISGRCVHGAFGTAYTRPRGLSRFVEAWRTGRAGVQLWENGVVHYGDYQTEIYGAGLSGRLPKLPVDFRGLEARAHAAMPPWLVSYVAGGCGNEHTQEINVSAFERWGLIPRMLVGAAKRDMSVNLFGMRLPTPIFMSPIGVIGLCAQDGHGDIGTARAARKLGVPMIASTFSNDPLEEVASEFGETPGFFQLYTPTDRALAESLVSRAEAAGFKGIVVTLDTWVTGWRPRDLNQSNFPQLRGHASQTPYFAAVSQSRLRRICQQPLCSSRKSSETL